MNNTVIDILNEDPQSLMLLIREVYNKGLDDGVQTYGTDKRHIFAGWDYISNSLDKEFFSIEDFVDYIFNEEENYYENTY